MVRDQIQTTDGAMITHLTYRHGMEAAKETGEKKEKSQQLAHRNTEKRRELHRSKRFNGIVLTQNELVCSF